jgi:glycosyltransferase involved in cell wall biosynthesis
MIIGIDASNIREGGGLTHLKAILQFANPKQLGIDKIVVWSSIATLNQIPEVDFVEKVSHKYLNKSTLFTFLFQFFLLKKEAKNRNCEVLFAPGGTFISAFRPFVTMSQNMLPFEIEEAKHYGWKMRLRLKILHFTQTFAFKKANGLIFLTQYAKNYISKAIHLKNTSIIIPHGVNPAFKLEPRVQNPASFYTKENLFEFLYVSYITVYKHQWNVAEAVCQLHQEGFPIKVKLIGSVLDSFEKVQEILAKYPNSKECVEYIAGLPHQQLIEHYHTSDAFVFASSCENMPIILIEAMSAGLPIISSNSGPMQEVLNDAGLYFNPRNLSEIKKTMVALFENHQLRTTLAQQSYQKTNEYSWENCAKDTFQFLVKTAKEYKN